MALPDLTTIDSLKAYIGETGSADDELLADLITAYSAAVRSYLGRDISATAYDIVRSGRGTFAMYLPQYPVISVDGLAIDGMTIQAAPSFGQTGFVYDDEQVALRGHMFTRGIMNVRIQYTAGYATVPADLAQAVNELIALRFAQRNNVGWSSKTLAGETVSLDRSAMPAGVVSALGLYRSIIAA